MSKVDEFEFDEWYAENCFDESDQYCLKSIPFELKYYPI